MVSLTLSNKSKSLISLYRTKRITIAYIDSVDKFTHSELLTVLDSRSSKLTRISLATEIRMDGHNYESNLFTLIELININESYILTLTILHNFSEKNLIRVNKFISRRNELFLLIRKSVKYSFGSPIILLILICHKNHSFRSIVYDLYLRLTQNLKGVQSYHPSDSE